MFGRLFLSVAAAIGAIASANAQGSVDIGTVGIAGYHTGSGSDFQVYGSGSDIWSSYDHFHFMHFNRTGDVTVTCKVKSFTGADSQSWRKGGIMFRAGLGQRAAHSMIQQTGWGVAHQYRTQTNGNSLGFHDSYSTTNTWLRLVKKGNTVTSYVKKDGEYGFMYYHSHEVDLGEQFEIGLAITSHDNALLAKLDVSDFEISDEAFSFSMPGTPTEVGVTGSRVWVQEVKQGLWSLSAAGEGITGTADAFGFFDSQQTGDVTATIHLEKLVRRNADTKGGLMMRATRDVDSPHVSLLVKSDTGVTMFWRETVGGPTQSLNVGVWEEDVELRLVKTGDTVQCSYKHSSAPEWYVLGQATAALGATYFVGPAVSSADHGDRISLTVGDIAITPAVV